MDMGTLTIKRKNTFLYASASETTIHKEYKAWLKDRQGYLHHMKHLIPL